MNGLVLSPEELAFLRRQTWHVIRNLTLHDRQRKERGRDPLFTNRIAFLSNLATKLETASCGVQSPSSAG